ncbi:hypothetical protein TRFO_23680 [Tritrichomonas foetus]|uniref:Uncharacterized protein n=1 Tax=Tritrichomonas foetus TaxID=1144522 RepID=A0A1J4K9R5_9EUKA|nr:hypothetical protein TRFO_23680 [Tritrichomonas foetus]|eukprot:OHT07979.1 hypothetical protein TRFO_23680 [Tritrichomonas foetus]
MLLIEDLVDFTNAWFYVGILCPLFLGLLGVSIHTRISEVKYSVLTRKIYFLALFLLLFIDNIVFILSVKYCPHAFISYLWSIYVPLIVLFLTIIFCSIFAIKSLSKYGFTIHALNDMNGIFFFVIGTKISYCLAYGSLCGIIWILVDFILTLVKLLLIPESFGIAYEDNKKYD